MHAKDTEELVKIARAKKVFLMEVSIDPIGGRDGERRESSNTSDTNSL